MTRIVKSVGLRIGGSQRAKLRIDLRQRDRKAGHARGQREAGGADAGAQLDHVLAGAPGGCSGQQNGVMPDPMSAPGC